MAGRGSKPGERRGGRQKGTPNKQTAALKDMILGALDQVGGQAYLARQANENPAAFMTLVGKVLPTTLTGDKAAPVAHVIELVPLQRTPLLEGPGSTPAETDPGLYGEG